MKHAMRENHAFIARADIVEQARLEWAEEQAVILEQEYESSPTEDLELDIGDYPTEELINRLGHCPTCTCDT